MVEDSRDEGHGVLARFFRQFVDSTHFSVFGKATFQVSWSLVCEDSIDLYVYLRSSCAGGVQSITTGGFEAYRQRNCI